MLGWDAGIVPFFLCKTNTDIQGCSKASVTPTGSFGINNQETRMCGDPLGEFPLMGRSQLETTVNCKLCRCSMHAGLLLCLKLNILYSALLDQSQDARHFVNPKGL